LDGELNDALRFIDRFRLEYLGIKDPYELDFGPAQPFPVLQDTEKKEQDQVIPEEVVEEEEDDDGF
ncbi:MAG: hypothetical protein KFF73_20470, partial [Cyclobacteriaceae bacterium]|nr:hypothetical protein [Cyclobacteriaceae bacterium]